MFDLLHFGNLFLVAGHMVTALIPLTLYSKRRLLMLSLFSFSALTMSFISLLMYFETKFSAKIIFFGGATFFSDGYINLILMMVNLLEAVVLIYGYEEFKKMEDRQISLLLTFLSLSMASLTAIMLSSNIMFMVLFYFVFILSVHGMMNCVATEEIQSSVMKFLKVNVSSVVLLLLPVVILSYSVFNGTKFSESPVLTEVNKGMLVLILSMFVFGIGTNLFAPTSRWIIEMRKISPIVFIFIQGAFVNVALVMIMKFLRYYIGFDNVEKVTSKFVYGGWIVMLFIFSSLYGAFGALFTKGDRRRLTYSTISQSGYIIAGMLTVKNGVLLGVTLWICSHIISKSVLLMIVDVLKNDYKVENSKQKSIAFKNHGFGFIYCLMGFSIAGIPPLFGFYGKYIAIKQCIGYSKGIYSFVVFLGIVINILYIWPALKGLFSITKEDQRKIKIKGKVSKFKVYSIWFLTLVVIFCTVLMSSLIFKLV